MFFKVNYCKPQRRKTLANTRLKILLTVLIVSFFSVSAVIGQIKNERKSISCEYLKVVLDKLSYDNQNRLFQTKSGELLFVVFVISSGGGKSNVKLARKFKKGLDDLLKVEEKYRGLRYEIIEGNPVKGNGRFQVFFLDEKQDYEFGNTIFSCS